MKSYKIQLNIEEYDDLTDEYATFGEEVLVDEILSEEEALQLRDEIVAAAQEVTDK